MPVTALARVLTKLCKHMALRRISYLAQGSADIGASVGNRYEPEAPISALRQGRDTMLDDRYTQWSRPHVGSHPRRLALSERLPRACNALESS